LLFERDLFAKSGSRLFRIILCQYLSLRVTIDATKRCRLSSIRRQRREFMDFAHRPFSGRSRF